jgi:hypothetical protein
MHALASRLLAMEEITAKEAAVYLRAPRKGRGYKPLLRPWRAVDEPRGPELLTRLKQSH